MDTPSSLSDNTITLPLRRSRAGKSLFGMAGEKAAAHQVELHAHHLVVPASDISVRRVEVPLDQVTGIRIVPELMRSLLTIEAGSRIFNLGLAGKAMTQAARSFVTATRDRIYIIEASSNLVDWEKIGVAAEGGPGEFEFEDTTAARMATRYYRIVVP